MVGSEVSHRNRKYGMTFSRRSTRYRSQAYRHQAPTTSPSASNEQDRATWTKEGYSHDKSNERNEARHDSLEPRLVLRLILRLEELRTWIKSQRSVNNKPQIDNAPMMLPADSAAAYSASMVLFLVCPAVFAEIHDIKIGLPAKMNAIM